MTLIWENFDYQGKYTNASVSEAVQTSIINRDATSGGAGGAAAPPDFGRSEGAL